MFEDFISNMNTALQNLNSEQASAQSLLEPGLCHYLILGLIIFIIGIIIVITSKNLIKILIGLEFMLNSAGIDFVAANAFLNNENAPIGSIEAAESTIANSFAPMQNLNFTFSVPEGQAATIVILAISAINAAAFLGLVCAIFFKFKNAETEPLCTLKSADCPTDKDLENESGL